MIIDFKKVAFGAAVISLIVFLAGCKNFFQAPQTSQPQTKETTTEAKDSVTITYTQQGFDQQTVVVKSGGTIKWVNNSQNKLQVGSANHPSHTINQEISGNNFVLEVAPGQSQTITVSKVGTWGYHDHLAPGRTGKIIVQ